MSGNLKVAKRRVMAGDREIPLSPFEERLLFALVARSPAPVETKDLIHVVYGDREDGGPDTASQCLRVIICRLRKKLERLGWQVPCNWGKSYFLRRSKQDKTADLNLTHESAVG